MSDEPKLCNVCAHSRVREGAPDQKRFICKRPIGHSRVDGKVVNLDELCVTERCEAYSNTVLHQLQKDRCGPDGKYWEAM